MNLEWNEISTNNFVIYSSISKQKTRQLAATLENFRSLYSLITNSKLPVDKIKTYIYIFPSIVPEVGLDRKRDGLFTQLLRSNLVVMRSWGSNDISIMTLQHEYTHYLMTNTNNLEYPAWYAEGFADLLSTVLVKNNKVEVGIISPFRAYSLLHGKWKPFKWVINLDGTDALSPEDGAKFYAQSWALVYYLNIGRKNHNFAAESKHYFSLLKKGKNKEEAFEQAYSVNLDKIESSIHSTLKNNLKYVVLKLKNPMQESSIKVHKLKKDVIAVKLGLLCLVHEKTDCAKKLYSRSLKINPNQASAMDGLADVYELQGRFNKAESGYIQAIKLEPDVSMHYLEYGEYLNNRAIKTHDSGLRRKLLDRARVNYKRSLSLDPDNLEALVMYGNSFFVDQHDKNEMLIGLSNLLTAYKYMPANPIIKMSLANAYAMAGMKEQARQLAEQVHGWSHIPASNAAAEFLKSLDNPGK